MHRSVHWTAMMPVAQVGCILFPIVAAPQKDPPFYSNYCHRSRQDLWCNRIARLKKRKKKLVETGFVCRMEPAGKAFRTSCGSENAYLLPPITADQSLSKQMRENCDWWNLAGLTMRLTTKSCRHRFSAEFLHYELSAAVMQESCCLGLDSQT